MSLPRTIQDATPKGGPSTLKDAPTAGKSLSSGEGAVIPAAALSKATDLVRAAIPGGDNEWPPRDAEGREATLPGQVSTLQQSAAKVGTRLLDDQSSLGSRPAAALASTAAGLVGDLIPGNGQGGLMTVANGLPMQQLAHLGGAGGQAGLDKETLMNMAGGMSGGISALASGNVQGGLTTLANGLPMQQLVQLSGAGGQAGLDKETLMNMAGGMSGGISALASGNVQGGLTTLANGLPMQQLAQLAHLSDAGGQAGLDKETLMNMAGGMSGGISALASGNVQGGLTTLANGLPMQQLAQLVQLSGAGGQAGLDKEALMNMAGGMSGGISALADGNVKAGLVALANGLPVEQLAQLGLNQEALTRFAGGMAGGIGALTEGDVQGGVAALMTTFPPELLALSNPGTLVLPNIGIPGASNEFDRLTYPFTSGAAANGSPSALWASIPGSNKGASRGQASASDWKSAAAFDALLKKMGGQDVAAADVDALILDESVPKQGGDASGSQTAPDPRLTLKQVEHQFNPVQLSLLAAWLREAYLRTFAHQELAASFFEWHIWLGMPTVLFVTITSALGATSSLSDPFRFALIGCSFVAAILSFVFSNSGFAVTSDQHRAARAAYRVFIHHVETAQLFSAMQLYPSALKGGKDTTVDHKNIPDEKIQALRELWEQTYGPPVNPPKPDRRNAVFTEHLQYLDEAKFRKNTPYELIRFSWLHWSISQEFFHMKSASLYERSYRIYKIPWMFFSALGTAMAGLAFLVQGIEVASIAVASAIVVINVISASLLAMINFRADQALAETHANFSQKWRNMSEKIKKLISQIWPNGPPDPLAPAGFLFSKGIDHRISELRSQFIDLIGNSPVVADDVYDQYVYGHGKDELGKFRDAVCFRNVGAEFDKHAAAKPSNLNKSDTTAVADTKDVALLMDSPPATHGRVQKLQHHHPDDEEEGEQNPLREDAARGSLSSHSNLLSHSMKD